MSDLSHTLLHYGRAWREADADKRMAHLQACFAENGRYVDPTADVAGRIHLCEHIGQVLESSGGRVEIASEPVSHHDVVHFTWHMVGPDGALMVSGHDFARFNADGLIEHLAGFFGSPPALT